MSIPHLNGVMLIDGTSSAPALAFNSDTNTGIYRSAADTLNVSINGSSMLAVNSSGITSGVNVYTGTNGQFRNYAGVWKGTTGQAGGDAQFILNGKTIMHIDEADENVGIGTTAPAEKLHIADSGNPKILIQDTSADNQAGIRFKTTNYEWSAGLHGGENAFKISNHSSFGTNDFLTVKSTGRVGIGTTSPSEPLDVVGTARMDNAIVEGTLYAGDSVQHWGDGGTGVYFNTDEVLVKTASTTALTINSSQNATFAGNITFGDSHFIGDDSFDNLHILASSGENVVIQAPSGNSIDLKTAGGSTLNLDSSQNATFAGHVKIASGKYLEFSAMGKLINMDVPAWNTGAQEHNLLYSGWTSSTGDYLSLKVAGNSTGGHGNLIIGDNGLWYGTMDTENTAQATDSATNPNGNTNRFRVDSSGNGTFAGTVTSPKTFISTSVGTGNPTPATDNVRFNGYGMIGNRGNLYVTNSNSSGVVQIGIGGAHNGNPKLTIGGSTSHIRTNLLPGTDSTYNIGSNASRFSNIYADTLYGDGSNITGVTATDSTKLPLAGGTITGNLTVNGVTTLGDATSDSTTISGSTILNKKAASGTNISIAQLKTANGSTTWSIGGSNTSNDNFMIWAPDKGAGNYFQINKTSGQVKIGADASGSDLIVYGNETGERMFWDASESNLTINHDTDDSGLEIYTVGSAQPTTHQIKVGRDSSQYLGIRVDDGRSYFVHRQDETGGSDNHHQSNQIWTNGGGTHTWNWDIANNSGGSASNKMQLNSSGNLTVAGQITSGRLNITDAAVPIIFTESGNTGTGKYWRQVLDGGDIRFDVDTTSTNGDGTFASYNAVLQLNADGHTDINGALDVAGNTTFSNNVVIGGNLTITGDINTETVNNLDVVDKLITVGKGQTEANSTGSGILVDGSNASLLWDETNNTWDFNKSLDVVGNINASGNLTTGGDILVNTTTSGGYIQIDHSDDSLKLADANKLKIGTGNDLQIYHNSTTQNGIIENFTNDLVIQNNANDKDVIFKSDNGSGGVATYFKLDGGNVNVSVAKDFLFQDNVKARFGNNGDLEIYHNATDSAIQNNTGDLYISNFQDDGDIIFRSDNGSGGHTAYMKIDGGSENVQFAKDVFLYDNVFLNIGGSFDLRLYHDGNSNIKAQGSGDLIIAQTVNDADMIFKCDDGSGGVAEYFRLDGSQATGSQLLTLWPDNSKIIVGDGADGRFFHDGTNTYLQNTTGDLIIQNFADDSDIIFKSDDGSGGTTTYLFLDGSLKKTLFWQSTRHIDNVYATFGASDDLQIFHNGTNSTIQNFTGNLTIRNDKNDGDIELASDDGSGGVTPYFTADGSEVENLFNKKARFPDNVKLTFGGSRDLQILHNGTHSFITNATGDLTFANYADDRSIYFQSDDGGGGAANYIQIDGANVRTLFTVNAEFSDNVKAKFGDGDDLEIYHDGSDSYISDVGTGNLYLKGGNQVRIVGDAANSDEIWAVFGSDAAELWFNGNKKFETTNTGATLTGNLVMGSGQIKFADSGLVMLGDSNDLQIKHDGTNSEVSNLTGNLNIKSTATDGDISFYADDASGGVTEYFRVDGGEGRIVYSQNGRHLDNVVSMYGSGADLQIKHDGSNSYISNNTGALYVQQLADDSDIVFQSDDGSGGVAEYFKVDGGAEQVIFSKEMKLLDDVILKIGGGGDLRFNHNATDSFITNNTGNLTITNNTDDGDIIFKSDNGSGGTTEYFRLDGSSQYNIFQKDLYLTDNTIIRIGTGQDLRIYHNGTDSYIDDAGTGDLRIRSNFLKIEKYTGETMATFNDDNAVTLYYNNSAKFATTNTGISVTGDISVSGDIKGRSVPMVIHASFDDTTSTTANRIIPLMGSIVETSVSGGYAPHFFTIPYACVLKRVIMKTVAGSQSSSFTTELKAYKNGAVTGNSSSGELTHSNSSITWNPTAHNDITYAAGDKFSLVYQKSATSKYWQDVAVTIVFTLTNYDI